MTSDEEIVRSVESTREGVGETPQQIAADGYPWGEGGYPWREEVLAEARRPHSADLPFHPSQLAADEYPDSSQSAADRYPDGSPAAAHPYPGTSR